MLERHETEALLTLAEELHFGRTAERLRVSTSRVSQTIRQLERRVGAPLFRRTSRRVELTPIGRRLVEEIRPAHAEIEEAVQRAVEAGRGLSGSLRVGFAGPAGGQLMARVAADFRGEAPDCEVVLRQTAGLDVVDALSAGELDVALTLTPPDDAGLACGPVLIREAVVVAVPAAHPYARRSTLTTADLSRATLLRLPWMPAVAEQDIEAVSEDIATLDEGLTLVGLGRGLLPVAAHVQRYHPRPDVVYRPLVTDSTPHPTPLEWRLVWLPDRETERVRSFSRSAASAVATSG